MSQTPKRATSKAALYDFSSIDKTKLYLRDVEKKFGIKEKKDWYNIPVSEFSKQNGARKLLKQHNGKLFNILTAVYPEENWNALTFNKVPRNYWNSIENQRSFLLNLSKSLKLKELKDLVNIKQKQILKYGGRTILSKYNSNSLLLLSTLFPDICWDAESSSKKRFDTLEKQRSIILSIGKKLNFEKLDDFHLLTTKDLKRFKAKKILTLYSNIFEMLKSLFPEHEWSIFKLKTKPRTFWHSKENHILFLHYLVNQLNLNSIDELKNISISTVLHYGGKSLIEIYGSLYNALTALFPQRKWNIFESQSSKKWNSVDLRVFAHHIIQHYYIQRQTDWYRISQKQIKNIKLGGRSLLHRGGLIKLLQTIYPDHQWSSRLSSLKTKKSTQFYLFSSLHRIFQKHTIYEEYYHPMLSFPSHSPINFDFFIPSLNLVIEYNGEHHYEDVPAIYAATEAYQIRDSFKANVLKSANLQLIIVPFWWNFSDDALLNIFRSRAELFL